jgi:hypothetical protein
MLIEFRMASFSWVAFWKIDAVDETSPLLFDGGPRGGNSGCCSVGVTTFEFEFELPPDRRPEEEPDPELRDLLRFGPRALCRFHSCGTCESQCKILGIFDTPDGYDTSCLHRLRIASFPLCGM